MKSQTTQGLFSMDVKRYPIIVSLDVHAGNIYMYAVDIRTGTVLADCNLPGKTDAVLKHLQKIHINVRQTVIIYEAGPAGFPPYRIFTKNGFACGVIAPSSIPRQVKRNKTDRNDAINNLQYCASGLLGYVHVPDSADESNRELIRYRYDLVYQTTKQKQKIGSFLKRSGIVYELTKTTWTQAHRKWLTRVELPKAGRYLLNLMLRNLDSLETQLEMLDKELDSIVQSNPQYEFTVNLVANIAGFGRVGAITLAMEIVDFSRFAHPNALMSFTGLVPGKYASGASDPSMGITKAGNGFLRIAYINAARSYRDRRLLRTNAFLKKQPEPMREFITRLQDRLYARYRHLCSNGKHSNKAKCAIARELCGFTWELFVKIAKNLEVPLKQVA
jgi:transposase